MQHRDGQMRGGAESEQSHTIARRDASHTQTAKSDDSGTEERRGVRVIQILRQRENKIIAREGILSVASIHAVTSEGGQIAEIFLAAAAIAARAIRAADPGYAHPCSQREVRCRSIH